MARSRYPHMHLRQFGYLFFGAIVPFLAAYKTSVMIRGLTDSAFTFRNSKYSKVSFISYFLDWAIYGTLLIVFMIYGATFPPRYHQFLTNDISIQNDYKDENETMVPIPALLFISVGLPIIQFILCTIFCHTLTRIRKFWDIYIGLLVLCGAMATQLMITCILKNICGLPRPDLISRCQPDSGSPVGALSSVDICTNDNMALLQEGFRTFPSGHSSTVFCGMVLSSLNIAAKLQVFDQRGISIKIFFATSPIMVACFVSCTRISDNRHFLKDVIGGLLIGICVAIVFYVQYFPWISNVSNGGRAYPPRRFGVSHWFNNVGGFWKIRDKLPGSYNQRVLNDIKVFKGLQMLNVGDQIGPPESFEDVGHNIKIFNDLNDKFKGQYMDIEKVVEDAV